MLLFLVLYMNEYIYFDVFFCCMLSLCILNIRNKDYYYSTYRNSVTKSVFEHPIFAFPENLQFWTNRVLQVRSSHYSWMVLEFIALKKFCNGSENIIFKYGMIAVRFRLVAWSLRSLDLNYLNYIILG